MVLYQGEGSTSAPPPHQFHPVRGQGWAIALAFVMEILLACCIWFINATVGSLPPAFNWFPRFTGLGKEPTIARTDIFRGMNAAPWSTYGFCNNIFPVWDFRIHRIASTHANHFVISVTVTIQWCVEAAALWKIILKLNKKMNILTKSMWNQSFSFHYCRSVLSHKHLCIDFIIHESWLDCN